MFRPVRAPRSSSAVRGYPFQVRCECPRYSQTKVELRLSKALQYGSNLYVVGNTEALGAWNTSRAQPLTWSEGDVWQGVVEICKGDQIEYKYLIRSKDGLQEEWQPGVNQVLCVEDAIEMLTVHDVWDFSTDGRELVCQPESVEGGVETHTVHSQDKSLPKSKASSGEPLHAGRSISAVHVELQLCWKVPFGCGLCVVGSAEQLGAWEASAGREMQWSDGDVWTASFEATTGDVVEYKYIVVGRSGAAQQIEWQQGPNQELCLEAGARGVAVADSWKRDRPREVDVAWEAATVVAEGAAGSSSPGAPKGGRDGGGAVEQQLPPLPEVLAPSGRLTTAMSVMELKDELRGLGLDSRGRKPELVRRLV
eukprot:CAMPEP_0177592142 /NCGR_PEP_ID=MMETSP0419_2-20121207/8393_1 /TAXON_ID=582737 /ORGANISM="Tetraselmis sp., Strain GSL018" /LENGTH=365 /DNA_ID=CAMNT_0019082971 /DNA_START=227 /DNA_END=1321 /DNA_ORIENTATION=-